MKEFITQSEIENLSERELRAKLFELFNALAQREHFIQECEEMKAALHRIQFAIYSRKIKPVR